MKRSLLLISFLLLTSCEVATLKYGYYWNPVNVLEKAAAALESEDVWSWTELLSGRVRCVYGTKAGMNNVRNALKNLDQTRLEEPLFVGSRHLDKPHYLGFYSYYQETYTSTALDATGKKLLKVTLLCDFGSNTFSQKLLRVSPSKYGIRSCSIVAIKNYLRHHQGHEACGDS